METSEEYLLQWKSHNSEIINEFHNLCKDEQFTDCTIAAEEETFKAHKLILSACSPYFKSLFAKTPCQHPVIFLKDIPADHVAQLLKYMYLGQISVKREDLNTILQTANGLRIRGLMTENEPDQQHDQHASFAAPSSTKTPPPPPPLVSNKEGRKGYVPKKLRAPSSNNNNVDMDSVVSSPPRALSEGQMEPEPSGVSPDNGNGGTGTPEGSEGSPDDDQPWNLSQNGSKDGSSTQTSTANSAVASAISIGKAKFPILGNYLKNGGGSNAPVGKKPRTGSIDDLLENMRNNGRRNSEDVNSNGSSPVVSSQTLAQSWLEQITSMQTETTAETGDSKSTIPLQETLGLSGIDIAERIRAMAGPLSQTYGNWLNNAAAVSAAAAAATTPTSTAANSNATPPPVLPPPPPAKSSEPVEIGPNGKPSVTCEICGKKLADPSSLYRHRKIHSGDKPHKCPFCSRRFIQRYNMKQHMKTHRIERMENPELAAAIAAGEYSLPRMTKNNA